MSVTCTDGAQQAKRRSDRSTLARLRVRSISVLGETIYIYISTPFSQAAPRVDCSEGKQVYFVRGKDIRNITLQTEQFDTIEEDFETSLRNREDLSYCRIISG